MVSGDNSALIFLWTVYILIINSLKVFKLRSNINFQPWEAKTQNQENKFSVKFMFALLDYFISERVELQRLCS